jgi:hypothetical protein
MSQARTSYLAVASLGVGTFTLGLYFFASRVSPLLAAVAILMGLWAVYAVRTGVGRLTGYPFAVSGMLLGVVQFLPLLIPESVAPVTGVTVATTT